MNNDTNEIFVPFIPQDVALLVVRENISLFRAWRIRLGLSVEQIASAADMSCDDVEKLDCGENGISGPLMRAARIMGLEVCGVDLLRSNHGPVVMEVNSSPGLEGIEKASEKDVAGTIIQYLEKRVVEVANRGSRSRTRGKG